MDKITKFLPIALLVVLLLSTFSSIAGAASDKEKSPPTLPEQASEKAEAAVAKEKPGKPTAEPAIEKPETAEEKKAAAEEKKKAAKEKATGKAASTTEIAAMKREAAEAKKEFADSGKKLNEAREKFSKKVDRLTPKEKTEYRMAINDYLTGHLRRMYVALDNLQSKGFDSALLQEMRDYLDDALRRWERTNLEMDKSFTKEKKQSVIDTRKALIKELNEKWKAFKEKVHAAQKQALAEKLERLSKKMESQSKDKECLERAHEEFKAAMDAWKQSKPVPTDSARELRPLGKIVREWAWKHKQLVKNLPCDVEPPPEETDPCLGKICDDANPCTTDGCDSTSGNCTTTNVAEGTSCSATGGKCGGFGKCVEPVVDLCAGKVCDDANPCTADSCSSPTGNCVFADVAAGTVCPGGQCDGAGKCDLCAEKVCDDLNPCTADKCDSTSGNCVANNLPQGTSCSETGGTCDAAGKCVEPIKLVPCLSSTDPDHFPELKFTKGTSSGSAGTTLTDESGRAYTYGENISITDYCKNVSELAEFYCPEPSAPDVPRVIITTTFPCVNSCFDGACKLIGTCQETDHFDTFAEMYAVKGTSTGILEYGAIDQSGKYYSAKQSGTFADYCESTAKLKEFYCQYNLVYDTLYVATTSYACQFGCSDGRCLKEGEQPVDLCAGKTCDDANPCTSDSCNSLTGNCGYTNQPSGTVCSSTGGKCDGFGKCVEPPSDTLTIKGRMIDRFTQQPMPSVGIRGKWVNGVLETVATTNANGDFNFTTTTTDVNITAPKGFVYWPKCHMAGSIGLWRKIDNSLNIGMNLFDLLKDSYQLVASPEVNFGDIPIWTSVDIALYTDIPVKFDISYPEEGKGYGNIGYKTSHYLTNVIPLNYDVRARLIDEVGNIYYSPYTKYGLDQGCTPARLTFFNKQFAWGSGTMATIPAPTQTVESMVIGNKPGQWTLAVPSLTFQFPYASLSTYSVKGFRIYGQKPGETSFTKIAEFPNLPTSTEIGKSVYSNGWKLFFTPLSTSTIWTAYKSTADTSTTYTADYQPYTSYQPGAYKYYVVAVDAYGREGTASAVTTENILAPITILSPNEAQSPVTQPPTFKWTIASGWPSTPPNNIYLIDEATPWPHTIWYKQLWTSNGSYVYDGAALDPSKKYVVVIHSRYYPTYNTSYLSHAAAATTFWVK